MIDLTYPADVRLVVRTEDYGNQVHICGTGYVDDELIRLDVTTMSRDTAEQLRDMLIAALEEDSKPRKRDPILAG